MYEKYNKKAFLGIKGFCYAPADAFFCNIKKTANRISGPIIFFSSQAY
jgi:hypothetical protein